MSGGGALLGAVGVSLSVPICPHGVPIWPYLSPFAPRGSLSVPTVTPSDLTVSPFVPICAQGLGTLKGWGEDKKGWAKGEGAQKGGDKRGGP